METIPDRAEDKINERTGSGHQQAQVLLPHYFLEYCEDGDSSPGASVGKAISPSPGPVTVQTMSSPVDLGETEPAEHSLGQGFPTLSNPGGLQHPEISNSATGAEGLRELQSKNTLEQCWVPLLKGNLDGRNRGNRNMEPNQGPGKSGIG